MRERLRMGGAILLIKLFFIVPVLHFYLVGWRGQIICAGVSVCLMLLAFSRIRPRTPDLLLLLYGEIVQFLSVLAWIFVAARSRVEVETLGAIYRRSLEFSWDGEVFFFTVLGGVFQAVLLSVYRSAARYDQGWRD
ncbi:MAG: hypothetical protein LBP61_01985 [Desulfovibrio sp.]|jgi:hypothetical protein|nr:hypothetical protein [Desulfovibrio sp.]